MRRKTLLSVALICAVMAAAAGQPTGSADDPVPVTKEPLHVVQHRGAHFLIYTNWIEPGVWTLYHQHRNDLLAVIAADTKAAPMQRRICPIDQDIENDQKRQQCRESGRDLM